MGAGISCTCKEAVQVVAPQAQAPAQQQQSSSSPPTNRRQEEGAAAAVQPTHLAQPTAASDHRDAGLVHGVASASLRTAGGATAAEGAEATGVRSGPGSLSANNTIPSPLPSSAPSSPSRPGSSLRPSAAPAASPPSSAPPPPPPPLLSPPPPPAPPPAAALPVRRPTHIGGQAVSLSFLVGWAEAHVHPSLPTWAVVERLIKPHTLQDTIRYVDLPTVSPHVLPPQRADYYFVSHAWGRPFWEMVGLCAHHLRGAVASDTYVWIDVFIINQHPGRQQEGDLEQLRLAVRDAAATLVCSDAAGSPFTRIWCLFEMWVTLAVAEAAEEQGGEQQGDTKGGGDAAAEGSANARARLNRGQGLVVLTTGLSAAQRARLYGRIDATTSRATVASDKERILTSIASSVPGGLPAFNAALRCALLLRPAEAAAEPPPQRLRREEGTTRGSSEKGVDSWDFAVLDSWLALPPSAPHYRALALLGPAGSGKSTAAAAAAAHLARRAGGGGGGARGGGGEGVRVVAHFCRASDLQALDPLSALRTLAYQLASAFPQLQNYYAFELGKDGSSGGGGGGDGSGISFALRAIAGLATAGESAAAAARDGGYGGGYGSSPSNTDPVAAAFEALLLTPLQRMWQSYEDAVRQSAATADADAAGAGGGNCDASAEGRGDADGARASPTSAPSPPPAPPPPPASPPQLVVLFDAVDEGDLGGGGGHANAVLLMLQEHFPRLPPFVRLLLTARPLPHIRGVLAHAFDPWVIYPPDLRPPPPACVALLAARLRARPALAAALAAGGCGMATAEALAAQLWQASNGWMLFLHLSGDILEAAAATAAAATAAAAGVTTVHGVPGSSAIGPSRPDSLQTVLEALLSAAAAASAPALYRLYVRTVVAAALRSPAPFGDEALSLRAPADNEAAASAQTAGEARADAAGYSRGATTSSELAGVGSGSDQASTQQLVSLLEVLGAAREPLYLSQLQDMGLRVGASAAVADVVEGVAATAGGAAGAGGPVAWLGSLVSVRGYKLHGIHRSLFDWLASGGAAELADLLFGAAAADGGGGGRADGEGCSGGLTSRPGVSSGSIASMPRGGGSAGGLRRGHVALAAMVLRDVAASRASQSPRGGGGGGDGGGAGAASGVGGGGGGGGDAGVGLGAGGGGRSVRGPRAPDAYSLYHGVAHVLEAAADLAAAGDDAAALELLRSLLLDFYFWRCVYQHGAAAGAALQSLMRHEVVFAAAADAASVAAAAGGGAAALAADVARWLQSYHGSLLRHPEALLQSALALPAASAVRAAALVAVAASGHAAAPACSPAATPTEPAGPSPPAASPQSAPQAAQPPAGSPPPPAAPAAQLSGAAWPRPYALSNPASEWDACLLATEGRGVTRGLGWEPGAGLLLAARDDRKVHLISPITGTQVGILEGHTDRVYCIALQPPPTAPTAGRATASGLTAVQPAGPATLHGSGAAASPGAPAAPGGRLVASGSQDGSMALWDGASRVLLQRLAPGETQDPSEGGGTDGGGGRPQATSFGFSAVENRPTGPGSAASVDCVAFSPDGAWLAVGTGDGSIAVWRMTQGPSASDRSNVGDTDPRSADTNAAAAPRAAKAWVCRGAHSKAAAGLAFLQLPQHVAPHVAPSASVGVRTPAGGGLLLASCSEDGAIQLWDPCGAAQLDTAPHASTAAAAAADVDTSSAAAATANPLTAAADATGSFAVISAPLRTLRADSEAQVRYETTGEEPEPPDPSTHPEAGKSPPDSAAARPEGTLGPDPWHIRGHAPSSSSGCRSADGGGGGRDARGGGGGGGETPARPSTGLTPLLSGVAEDADGPQSRASYRAPEHHCLAAGPGLPPGCLLAGSGSGPVAVWDVAGGVVRERLRGHTGPVRALALLDGGPHFASGSGDCTIRLWRHRPSADPRGWASALQAAMDVAVEDAAAASAAAAANGKAQDAEAQAQAGMRDAERQGGGDGASKRRCRRPCQWQCVSVLRGHTRLVTSLVFLTPAARGSASPESSLFKTTSTSGGTGMVRLASASVDFGVRVWRVAHPAAAASTPDSSSGGDAGRSDSLQQGTNDGGGNAGSGGGGGHEGYSVNAVALSPDGRLVATAADDFTACLWDARSGALLHSLRGHYGAVHAVAFSRDSRRLATGAGDGDVRIFACEGQSVSAVGWCRGHSKAVTGVAFSHDGSSVASSSEDGTCRVWSIHGYQTSVLEGHQRGATSVAWADDDWLLATGAAGGDPGVQLWDGRMGRRINTYRYHVSDVVRLAFGSAPEPPPATSAAGAAAAEAASEEAVAGAAEEEEVHSPPRRRTLLLSVDVRGLACVWDAWGGGLLHYIENAQGADLAGSALLWLQARAMHTADLTVLLRPPPPDSDDEADGDSSEGGGGGGASSKEITGRRRRGRFPRRLASAAVVAVYPAGETVEVVAVGPGAAVVAAVTDRQRLYLYRPVAGGGF